MDPETAISLGLLDSVLERTVRKLERFRASHTARQVYSHSWRRNLRSAQVRCRLRIESLSILRSSGPVLLPCLRAAWDIDPAPLLALESTEVRQRGPTSLGSLARALSEHCEELLKSLPC